MLCSEARSPGGGAFGEGADGFENVRMVEHGERDGSFRIFGLLGVAERSRLGGFLRILVLQLFFRFFVEVAQAR